MRINICDSCFQAIFSPYVIRMPHFDCIAGGTHSKILRKIIINAKFHQDPFSTLILEHFLDETFKDMLTDRQFDVVTCIPSAPKHVRRRGIDLPNFLTYRLARKRHLKFSHEAIIRKGRKNSQIGLNRQDRFKNIRRSFVCKLDLHDKSILVVDDVYTTGATAEAVAKILLRSGAKNVLFLVLARTPKAIFYEPS
ncbi:MAG: ComF family protein [Bdellovibrionales bacterium]|nr:ComF family protein [Bdellovibrionales bacterium]